MSQCRRATMMMVCFKWMSSDDGTVDLLFWNIVVLFFCFCLVENTTVPGIIPSTCDLHAYSIFIPGTICKLNKQN